MSKNKSLHQLIHSLSTNEKRFFKLYASRHSIGGENNYVKLFSLFEKVKVFDDKEIKKLASKATFIKYFSAEKNYLYNLLLDCLDIYHRETSIDRQISKLINTGRVLMERKLNSQGASALKNAKKLSVLHDRQENLTTINYLLKMNDFGSEDISLKSLQKYHEEERNSLKQLYEKQKYQHAFEQLLLHRRLYGITADDNVVEELIAQYPHVAEPIPEAFDAFGIEAYYLISRLEYCRITRNKTEGRVISRKLLKSMECDQNKIAGEYIELYIYALFVFVAFRYYDSIEEAHFQLKKLRNLDKYIDARVTKNEHARCFEYYFTALTDLWLEKKSFSEIHHEIREFEMAFEKYEPYLTPTFVLTMHFNIACLFFGLGEYKEALKWVNKVRNTNTQFRQDIFYDLRTLNLIIHLELGNEYLLPSLIKSALYYHKNSRHEVGLQKLIISSINALMKAESKTEEQTIYETLRAGLLEMKDNPQENRIFLDVDLIAWVNTKCGSLVEVE